MKAHDPEPTGTSTTMSLRLRQDTKAKLAKLAQQTRRTRSFLANEAITTSVEHELAVIEGVERGLVDMKAGRVTSHHDAMRQFRDTIAGAQKVR